MIGFVEYKASEGDEVKQDAADLLEIRDYFDSLVEEGVLNEDYSLNEDWFEDADEDPEDWAPEKGEDYWYAAHRPQKPVCPRVDYMILSYFPVFTEKYQYI